MSTNRRHEIERFFFVWSYEEIQPIDKMHLYVLNWDIFTLCYYMQNKENMPSDRPSAAIWPNKGSSHRLWHGLDSGHLTSEGASGKVFLSMYRVHRQEWCLVTSHREPTCMTVAEASWMLQWAMLHLQVHVWCHVVWTLPVRIKNPFLASIWLDTVLFPQMHSLLKVTLESGHSDCNVACSCPYSSNHSDSSMSPMMILHLYLCLTEIEEDT